MNKISLAQLLARNDKELRTYDAAKVAKKAGFILEAQLENGGPWFPVQDIDHKHGLIVKAGGTWKKAFCVVFYQSVSDYSLALRRRGAGQ